MEPEEMAKNVDACYKNILEKFNPGARQLINAGKAYLKALHGAAAAAKIYLESLNRVAKQAQQGTCGGTADIGIAMQQMIDVQREIQSQQLNTLKAFYVDLIVPLENNIEKDTKVVQTDHKKFNNQYRTQYDVYSKALAMVKKHSKKSSAKSNRSSASYDKEIKHLQMMDEEKAKLDAFCELSLKEAIIQERKRYGFVLERQTSLSKHFLAHYGKGAALLEKHLDGWQETSKSREELPSSVEFLLGQQNMTGNDNMYTLPRTPVLALEDESDNFCSASQLRKSHSIDASTYLYEEAHSTFAEAVNPKINANSGAMDRNGGGNLSKSKSEYNLAFGSPTRSVRSGFGTTSRPKSLALPASSRGTVRALYAYLSSGEHQINFLEGDLILLLGDDPVSFHANANGDRNKGWYYGENIRTGKRGWFPLAYTEQVKDVDVDSGLGLRSQFDSSLIASPAGVTTTTNIDAESTTSGNSSASHSSSGPTTSHGMTPPLHPPAPPSALMKPSFARSLLPGQLIQQKQLQQQPSSSSQQQQQLSTSSALRPTSLLGDRTLFNKAPFSGFGKLRKSRSAFAERLLCPAATPSAPSTPVSTTEHGTSASRTTSTTPLAIASFTALPMKLSQSSSSSRVPMLSSPLSPSVIFSPLKKAPVPPPRILNSSSAAPLASPSSSSSSSSYRQSTVIIHHQQHQSANDTTNHNAATDISLRSSSDSGFANEPLQLQQQQLLPPPAPEVDYSDEDSFKCRPNLSDWLLYSSALDVSQNETVLENRTADWSNGNPRIGWARGNGNRNLTMTLDRPRTATGSNNISQNKTEPKADKYPPVLGYLATLTRTKASQQQHQQRQLNNNSSSQQVLLPTESAATSQQQQLSSSSSSTTERSVASKKLANLFSKNPSTTGTSTAAVKIKSKLMAAAPAILKTALMRSKSKESVIADSSVTESCENLWQHKSSVPCFVGWRPPMPLPKDSVPYVINGNRNNQCNRIVPQHKTVRVTRAESRRSNLGRRKFSSESDLLDASESGYYMAIDRLPPATPLSLLERTPYSPVGDDAEPFSCPPHTLPRNKIQSEAFHSSSTSLRVQFNLDRETKLQQQPKQTAATAKRSVHATPIDNATAADECDDYTQHWKRRLLMVENRFKLDRFAETDSSPWYDLWATDPPSVRLCEIAQL